MDCPPCSSLSEVHSVLISCCCAACGIPAAGLLDGKQVCIKYYDTKEAMFHTMHHTIEFPALTPDLLGWILDIGQGAFAIVTKYNPDKNLLYANLE